MATYIELVNQVLEDLRYNPATEADFANPSKEEVRIVKRLLNEAKDDIMARMGQDLVERQFTQEMLNPYLSSDHTTVVGTLSADATVRLTSFTGIGNDVTGWKISIEGAEYFDSNSSDVDGLEDNTPHIVISEASILGNTLVAADRAWKADAADTDQTLTGWSIYQDEFDLDASVRQVTSASTSTDAPLELVQVGPGQIRALRERPPEFGTPRFLYVFRSETAGSIWRGLLHPAPSRRIWVYYYGVFRLADLDAFDDSWDIEPEIKRMVKDRAVIRALSTPIKNDLEMAVLRRRDSEESIAAWRDSYTPASAGQRLRRQGPGEVQSELSSHSRFRFNIENP